MDRPAGTIIVAALTFLRGLFYLLIGILALVVGGFALLAGAFTGNLAGMDAGTITVVWSSLKIVVGLVFLGLGYGLFKVASWAWMWTVLLLILSIIVDIIPLFSGGSAAWISVIVSGVILVYMLTNNVRNAYLK